MNPEAKVQRWNEILKAGNLPGYNINFVIYAVIYGLAVLLWFGINASRPVVPDAPGRTRSTVVDAHILAFFLAEGDCVGK